MREVFQDIQIGRAELPPAEHRLLFFDFAPVNPQIMEFPLSGPIGQVPLPGDEQLRLGVVPAAPLRSAVE